MIIFVVPFFYFSLISNNILHPVCKYDYQAFKTVNLIKLQLKFYACVYTHAKTLLPSAAIVVSVGQYGDGTFR